MELNRGIDGIHCTTVSEFRPLLAANSSRSAALDGIAKLNRLLAEKYGDPEIDTRIAQYEMAYRMQTSVPDLMDLSKESESTFELYGPDSRKPGTTSLRTPS